MERKEFYSILFDEKTENILPSNLSSSKGNLGALQVNFYDNGDDEEFQFFMPFYANGKLCHLNSTDALLLFLMFEYNLKKIKILDEESFYVVLTREDEIIYQRTTPEKFVITFRFNDEKDPIYLDIDGFSTKILYKTRGMKKSRPLELYEINDIFVDWLKEYLKLLFREDYKNMYL